MKRRRLLSEFFDDDEQPTPINTEHLQALEMPGVFDALPGRPERNRDDMAPWDILSFYVWARQVWDEYQRRRRSADVEADYDLQEAIRKKAGNLERAERQIAAEEHEARVKLVEQQTKQAEATTEQIFVTTSSFLATGREPGRIDPSLKGDYEKAIRREHRRGLKEHEAIQSQRREPVRPEDQTVARKARPKSLFRYFHGNGE